MSTAPPLDNTEANRVDYLNAMIGGGFNACVSGVLLAEEALYQSLPGGMPVTTFLSNNGEDGAGKKQP